ncbi:MAG: DinB family protein [Phycisphaeraceae bacterium]|nr:MAG: DinB family protein [Phycisphaeraceae bacterium]
MTTLSSEPKVYTQCPGMSQINALSVPELISRYRMGSETIDKRVFQLAPEQVDQAFLPEAGVGRWPIRVLLGHVADAELVYIHRARRVVGEDNPVFSVWDENSFIDNGLYRHQRLPGHPSPMCGGHVAMLHTIRLWGAEWLDTLADGHWMRQGMHPEYGALRVRDIVSMAVWHLEHHARFLNMKIEKFLGPSPAQQTPRGGCGSGCGCHK